MEPKRTVASVVIFVESYRSVLLVKEVDGQRHFTGGEVPHSVKDTKDYEVLYALALVYHARNVSKDITTLAHCPVEMLDVILDYVEESSETRFVYFLVRASDTYMDSAPYCYTPKYVDRSGLATLKRLRELNEKGKLSPDVKKVIAELEEKDLF